MKKTTAFAVILLVALSALIFVSCNSSMENTPATPTQTTVSTEESTPVPECIHVWGELTIIEEAICGDDGYGEKKCRLCDYPYTVVIPKTNLHTEVIDAGTPANCTSEGLSSGKHCSVCLTVTVEQKKTEPLGHNLDTLNAIEPTCSNVGLTEGSMCKRCKTVFEEQEVIQKLDHKFVNNKCSCGQVLESVGLNITSNGRFCVVRGIGTCTDKYLVIPATYQGLPVTAIDAKAFEKNDNIVEVFIPESVTDVGTKAFYSCKNLKKITMSSGITYLPNECFADCISLENIIWSEELLRISERCFSGCTSLTSLTLPENLRIIHDGAFFGCKSLKSIFLPGSLRTIEQFAFYECDNVESYRFGGNKQLFRSIDRGFECFGYIPPIVVCIDGNFDVAYD